MNTQYIDVDWIHTNTEHIQSIPIPTAMSNTADALAQVMQHVTINQPKPTTIVDDLITSTVFLQPSDHIPIDNNYGRCIRAVKFDFAQVTLFLLPKIIMRFRSTALTNNGTMLDPGMIRAISNGVSEKIHAVFASIWLCPFDSPADVVVEQDENDPTQLVVTATPSVNCEHSPESLASKMQAALHESLGDPLSITIEDVLICEVNRKRQEMKIRNGSPAVVEEMRNALFMMCIDFFRTTSYWTFNGLKDASYPTMSMLGIQDTSTTGAIYKLHPERHRSSIPAYDTRDIFSINDLQRAVLDQHQKAWSGYMHNFYITGGTIIRLLTSTLNHGHDIDVLPLSPRLTIKELIERCPHNDVFIIHTPLLTTIIRHDGSGNRALLGDPELQIIHATPQAHSERADLTASALLYDPVYGGICAHESVYDMLCKHRTEYDPTKTSTMARNMKVQTFEVALMNAGWFVRGLNKKWDPNTVSSIGAVHGSALHTNERVPCLFFTSRDDFPHKPVTSAEFAHVICRMIKVTDPGSFRFDIHDMLSCSSLPPVRVAQSAIAINKAVSRGFIKPALDIRSSEEKLKIITYHEEPDVLQSIDMPVGY